jgi:hypothetical protein
MRLPGRLRSVLDQLIQVVQELHDETRDFLNQADDQQLWYNRGYANGVTHALDELGFAPYLDQKLKRDPPDVIQGHELMAWGKAYQHGFEMGEKETREVIGPHPAP